MIAIATTQIIIKLLSFMNAFSANYYCISKLAKLCFARSKNRYKYKAD